MFVDTHAHLFFKDFDADRDDVIRRAQDAGVEYIVCPGTDFETSRKSIELAERYDCVYAAVGFHPHDAKKAMGSDGRPDAALLQHVEQMSNHPRVVAIGEIGLDYHYNFSPPDVQREVFSAQIDIACRRDLPIIIHTRESETDVFQIVGEKLKLNGGWRHTSPKGVFHCFSGDTAMARQVIQWGFMISIPGPVTFPEKPGRPNTMAGVVRDINETSILLETDSPYLTPHPFRGKRNEPANIPFIAKKIAEIKGCAVEFIAESSTQATRKLFALR
jgi:TatD DNase family protein